VTEALQRHRLIEPQETLREGNRPERTIYRITDAGRLEVVDWLSDLLGNPVHEYTQFEGGLSLLPVLPPSDAVKLLEERCKRLEGELAQARAIRELLAERKVPRLFTIEVEHRWRMKEAELEWVRELVAEIASGALEGVAEWRRWHKEGGEARIVKLPAPGQGAPRRRSF
jgi:DNA-binding PadR family transcriptional regulator